MCICTCVIFRTVSEIQLFHCRVAKPPTIRNSAHTKPSTVFNISSGTTIAEAVNVQHISIFGICEDVRHFAQYSYSVTHYQQLQQPTDASYSGAVRREWTTILGAISKLLYSATTLSPKPFGIGHVYIYTFLLRMTETITSQNIGLSSWDTRYIPGCW